MKRKRNPGTTAAASAATVPPHDGPGFREAASGLHLTADYQPIPCAQHERLEFSVLRKFRLQLEYVENGERRREKVLPLDVNTRNGAEWLKFQREDGSETEIRLDAITGFQELPAHP